MAAKVPVKIRISNERLWELGASAADIDIWLKEVVGFGNWIEWIGITMVPWRTFEFTYEEDATMFALKFL